MKVLKLVSFNAGVAFVFDKIPDFKYTKFGDSIIGQCGPLLHFYRREVVSYEPKAFGGRKFILPTDEGDVLCAGDWWDGIGREAAVLYDRYSLELVTASTIERLSSCYVFNSFYAEKGAEELLINSCDDKTIHNYWEFKKMIK